MPKRFRCGCLFIACLALAGAVGQAQAADAAKRFNVLFIVCDDLRCGLGCYGSHDIQSPNIDRLAARGVRFDRAYCQYPVCNPSRSSFLTSKRPDTTGIYDNSVPLRVKHPDAVTLPQLLKDNGYYTAGIGKLLHQGINAKGENVPYDDPKSFDFFHNYVATATGRKGEGRNLTGGKLKWCSWLAAEGTDEDQPDGQASAEAIRQIEQHKDGPFFVGVGFHKPHDPFNAPKKYFDMYPLDKIELSHDPDDRTPDLPTALPQSGDANPFRVFSDKERREFKRAYCAGASFSDAQIGKLLDTLDRLKLWESTIVLVMGDHGYHLGEHGWWNKVTVFELCARTPLILWAPGLKGMGKPASGIVEFVDIFPTIAELCRVQPPAGQQGVSFRPLLDDPSKPGKSAAFTQVTRGKSMGRSVRSDRWRYTEWDEGKIGVELYDHSNDPLEYHNLAGRTDVAAAERAMKDMLHKGPAGK